MLDMLNLTNTAKKLSPSESQTDTLTERQSLLTCVSSSSPVQPSSIEELRTWLAEAFPVSPLALQESKQAQTMPEICGLQQQTLFASSDLPAFSWKTYRDCSNSTTVKAFSLTLPKWGMWDATGLYPLPMWEPDTDDNDCGLLANWPSPTCSDVYTGNLKSTQQKPGSMHSVTLPQAVAMFPTPNARDWKDGRRESSLELIEKGHQITLGRAVHLDWPTPTAGLSKQGVTDGYFEKRQKDGRQVDTASAVYANGDGSVLNPDWVEWLLGWPVGWSDIKPLATLTWRDWQTDPADTGEVPRVTDVKENRANRLKAIGNGQVPQCVVKACELLS